MVTKKKTKKEVDLDYDTLVSNIVSNGKPNLIKCGNHFINPGDISSIRNVKGGKLWIVKFKGEPNPDFPCWLDDEEEVQKLLMYFNVIE